MRCSGVWIYRTHKEEMTMNSTITMTAGQTAIYDNDGNEAAQKKLMEDLMMSARAKANNERETVEIYTADGIVAATVDPE